MSYSIAEGIEDAEKTLSALRSIERLYPKARIGELPDGTRVWVDETARKDADRVRAVVDKAGGSSWLCAYREVEGMPVFVPWMHSESIPSALETLRKHQPEAYAMIAWVAGGKPVPSRREEP